MGRRSRGEQLRFRRLSSRTTVAIDNALVYADAIELVPETTDVAAAGVLEQYGYVASGFWLRRLARHLADCAPSTTR